MENNIETIAPEILVEIFKFLEINDLLNIRLTCLKFCCIINSFWEYLLNTEPPLVTNQINSAIKQKSQKLLSFHKYRISNNWVIGKFNDYSITISHKPNMPRLFLQNDYIWCSYEQIIARFNRNGNKINSKHKSEIFSNIIHSDVSDFRVEDNLIVSGNRNGIWLYSINDSKFLFELELNELDITCIDMNQGAIVIGSKEKKFLIYALNEAYCPTVKWELNMDEAIWSIASNGQKIALGMVTNRKKESIVILDNEKQSQVESLGTNQYGAGIMSLKWENDNILWSCGYDATVRKWDLRTKETVQKWWDPFDSTVYSMDLDFAYTILTGCSRHGRVVLWDTRKTDYVQLYFVKPRNSPIYGLAFDAESFFATSERHLNVFNFSQCDGLVKSYSNLFKTKIVI